MKIVILVGLPGSGKTTLGEELATASQNSVFIDDISVSGLNPLREAIAEKRTPIIIADVFLCRERERVLCSEWLAQNASEHDVEWIYFENNPDACLKNASRRNDGRSVVSLIFALSKEYLIPRNANTRKVFDQ